MQIKVTIEANEPVPKEMAQVQFSFATGQMTECFISPKKVIEEGTILISDSGVYAYHESRKKAYQALGQFIQKLIENNKE